MITFDDGTIDFWENGRPVLEKYGFSASLFIVTGSVGKKSDWDQHLGELSRPLMSWNQIRELHENRYEICSHTHTHRNLRDLNEQDVMSEFVNSKNIIADNLGAEPKFLAYPRGFYDTIHKQIAKEAGYMGACAVILKWRDLWYSDQFELKRMTIKGTETMFRFKLRLLTSKQVKFNELFSG
ncbi:MAG: hypothetical protein A2161_02925 [Candidatus Schekmanbacteria bacterium RBG_13_48_7]|uniref:NodB homology domain-containing protein n=1 Tax=Candidatus Schekmanbacteria bacterium RBG_13_48_7 TaxID=1817878 RepID=A0A1F7RVR1_9BACT|nr:MAG: hypothetical protein A2161_02925 [Candidatus Schekmanbacteria bacterium RBG_13_48_7]